MERRLLLNKEGYIMKKNRYVTPHIETVKIRTRMMLTYSGGTRTLQKYDGPTENDRIDSEDDLL